MASSAGNRHFPRACGVLTADEARKDAKLTQADVAHGGDPWAERKAKLRSLSVAALAEKLLPEQVALHCKDPTHYDYSNTVRGTINPAIGAFKITEITRADITDFHHQKRATPYQANRAVALRSKMFNVAEDQGLRSQGSNPATRIKKYHEVEKKCYLNDEEQARLGQVLFDGLEAGEFSQ